MKNQMKLFVQTLWSLVLVVRSVSFLSKLKRKPALKDVYILGNGPSLKSHIAHDLDFLKSKELFVVNSFALTKEFVVLEPSLYLFLDSAYFMRKNTALRLQELQNNLFAALLENVTWRLTLFIPKHTDMKKKWKELMVKNSNIHVVFINTNEAVGYDNISFFLYKNDLSIPPAQNVLVIAIFLSINMGYQNINILGADHSWTENIRVNENNELCILDKHFYSERQSLYFKGIEQKELWTMHEILIAYARMFEGYQILKKYSNYLNVNIYNLTEGSYIDAFPRRKLNDGGE